MIQIEHTREVKPSMVKQPRVRKNAHLAANIRLSNGAPMTTATMRKQLKYWTEGCKGRWSGYVNDPLSPTSELHYFRNGEENRLALSASYDLLTAF